MKALLVLVLALLMLGSAMAQDTKPELQRLSPVDWNTTDFIHGLVTGRYYDEMAADPAAFFDEWAAMGVDWIRIEFEEFMGRSETTHDSDEVLAARNTYLTIIEEAHARDIRVLGLVGLNAMPVGLEWEGDGNTDLTDASVERYVEALDWHLRTYPVDAVEIFNEPWGFGFGSDGSGPRRLAGYARLLIAAYSELKPEYPEVTFMAPVTANAEAGEWLGHHGWGDGYSFDPEASIFNNEAMQAYRDANDGRLPLDVISWHPYGSNHGTPDGNPDEIGPLSENFYFGRDFATYFRQITAQVPIPFEGPETGEVTFVDVAGRPIVGDYPIFFSEYGFQSTTEAGFQSVIGMYSDMSNAMSQFPQIKGALLYTYRDDPPRSIRPDSEEKKFGLYAYTEDGEFVRKPLFYAFVAHSTGAGLLDDGTFSQPLVEAYLLEGGRSVLGEATSGVTEDSGRLHQEFGDRVIEVNAQ